jgi:hypothetical protein
MPKYEPVGTVWKQKENPLPGIIVAVVILFVIFSLLG